jgi:hypothetical protein
MIVFVEPILLVESDPDIRELIENRALKPIDYREKLPKMPAPNHASYAIHAANLYSTGFADGHNQPDVSSKFNPAKQKWLMA